MPQYIQHPALVGAQMADEMSRQRMNLYGQAVAQAAGAEYAETAAQNAAERKALYNLDMINMGLNPETGQPLQARPKTVAYPQTLGRIQQNRAAELGINLSQSPNVPEAIVGPNRAVGTQPPLMNITELAGTPGFQFLGAYSSPTIPLRMDTTLNQRKPSAWYDVLGAYAPTGEPTYTGTPIGYNPETYQNQPTGKR